MERLEAFKDKPKKAKQTETPVIVHYAPKVLTEQFDAVEGTLIEVDHKNKRILLSSLTGDITIPFEDVYKLTQFLAWLMRERKLNLEDGAENG